MQLIRVTVLLTAALAVASPASAQGVSPVEGVWTRVEVSVVTDDGVGTNTKLQPSLYIFTREFFSVMYIDGPEPRPERGPRAKSDLTAAEKAAEYDPFVSYSGSYEFDEESLTLRPRVSLNPSFMGRGVRRDFYEVGEDGNVLWLIMRPRPDAGLAVREIRTKLERLEGGLAGPGDRFRIE